MAADGASHAGSVTQTPQTYENHVHKPVLTGIGTAFVVLSLIGFGFRWFHGGRVWMALGIIGLIGCNLVLLLISREYITRLQDRIIRTEMKIRCASFMTPEQQRMLAGLPIKHVAALRFASDAELPGLCERAVRENLTADQIKRAIRSWVPDYNRT